MCSELDEWMWETGFYLRLRKRNQENPVETVAKSSKWSGVKRIKGLMQLIGLEQE